MGTISSRHKSEKLKVSMLNDLDIVLIQSSVHFNGISLPYEVAKGVESSTHFKSFDREIPVNTYDRIGVITVPEWTHPNDKLNWTMDKITVTEATNEGIRNMSLKEVCEGSLRVAIRQCSLSPDVSLHEEVDEGGSSRDLAGSNKTKKHGM